MTAGQAPAQATIKNDHLRTVRWTRPLSWAILVGVSQVEDSSPRPGALRCALGRLVRSSQLLLPSAGLAWLLLWGLALASVGRLPLLLTSIFAAGALGLCTLSEFAILAVVAACLPACWLDWVARPTAAARASVVVRMLVAGGVALAVVRMASLALLGRYLPGIDLRAYFVDAGAWVLAGLAGAVAMVIAGRPTWKLALASGAGLLVIVRLVAHAALAVAFEKREAILELGSIGALMLALAPLAQELSLRFPWTRRAALCVFAALFVSAGVLFGLLGRRVLARAELVREFAGPAELVARARAVLDFDGDGYAAVLGGTDCDDFDSQVSPAALEIVGNGRDDNCTGGDLATWESPVDGPPRGAPSRRSLVLITVDALRADMLAAGQMDNLLAFSRGGARFLRAYTVAGLTDYALRSLMTGRYPMDFTNGEQFFGQELSLAERLGAAGYRTVGIHSVWSINPYTLQGFAEVDDTLSPLHEHFGGTSARPVSDHAVARFEALSRAGEPFFLWVHFYDPHSDYIPHADAPRFGDSTVGRYRQEVWATDHEMGRLLRAMEKVDFLANNFVVVTADHAEMIGEHGHVGHAYWQFEPVLRIPLVVRGPGVPAGEIPVRVRSIDLYPTLLGLTLAADAASDGLDLGEVWSGRETRDRDVFVFSQYMGSDTRAALVGPWKLMQDMKTGLEELIRLDSDPGEERNLVEQDADVAARIRQTLGERWDQSLNDMMMRRKLSRYNERRMVGELRDRNERRKLEYYCQQGFREDCEALRRFKPSTGPGTPAPAPAR